MVSSRATTVAQFLAEADPARRPALVAFRRLVKRAAPKAVESMSYGMPCYASGRTAFGFTAQKHYLSFYVCDVELIEKYAEELRGLDCGKSCLRGRRLEHFPLDVLEELVREAVERDRPPPSMARKSKTRARAKASSAR
jgi:uncharacterized protein YdhG (YjbR/CyaY superfamily)